MDLMNPFPIYENNIAKGNTHFKRSQIKSSYIFCDNNWQTSLILLKKGPEMTQFAFYKNFAIFYQMYHDVNVFTLGFMATKSYKSPYFWITSCLW
jgi:hypothetical protein